MREPGASSLGRPRRVTAIQSGSRLGFVWYLSAGLSGATYPIVGTGRLRSRHPDLSCSCSPPSRPCSTQSRMSLTFFILNLFHLAHSFLVALSHPHGPENVNPQQRYPWPRQSASYASSQKPAASVTIAGEERTDGVIVILITKSSSS